MRVLPDPLIAHTAGQPGLGVRVNVTIIEDDPMVPDPGPSESSAPAANTRPCECRFTLTLSEPTVPLTAHGLLDQCCQMPMGHASSIHDRLFKCSKCKTYVCGNCVDKPDATAQCCKCAARVEASRAMCRPESKGTPEVSVVKDLCQCGCDSRITPCLDSDALALLADGAMSGKKCCRACVNDSTLNVCHGCTQSVIADQESSQRASSSRLAREEACCTCRCREETLPKHSPMLSKEVGMEHVAGPG